MKNIKIWLIFLIQLSVISCFQNNNQKYKKTTIIGDIPNLPDGTIYLFKDNSTNRIDSTKTIKGKFTIIHKWDTDEPVYIGIDHIDNKGILRFFSFTTNAKYNGIDGWGTNIFLSDSTINLNGNLRYDTLIGVKLSSKMKPVTGPPLETGKQTKAFYSIDGDLFERISDKTFKIIKDKIKTYPYSYHLLYKIAENKNAFSPEQIDEFLKLFKDEITESKTFKNLSEYNKKRYHEKNASLPLLENVEGEKSAILNSKYKKHLVIFWASWCGPCRKEIPLLKKIYSTKDESLEFISISIDQDNSEWKKALNEEKMDWAQFITNEKDLNYEKIQMHFRLNSAIPYTVLIDNNYKILKYNVGLSSEQELYNFINKK